MAQKSKTPRGGKRKAKAELKDLYVSFRASGSDIKRIDALAARVGMPRSGFVNRAIMDAIEQIEAAGGS